MTDHSQTLNLPQTDFPMRADLPKREPERLKQWQTEADYKTLRTARAGQKKFTLHVGPPYANGYLHNGHLIPCLLKDMVVRARAAAGFDTPLVPGWDCHGLPIEWKVETGLREQKKNRADLSKPDFQALCRTHAEKWIATQKTDWQRMGVIGDWQNPYRTMDAANVGGIVRTLGQLAQTGLLFKGFKPVLWSTVEQTALAEAEVEYADKESTAVYVKFPLNGHANQFVLIWTTTPWTLPANRAVAYGNDIDYVAIQPTQLHEKAAAKATEIYWVAEKLLPECVKMLGILEHKIDATHKGTFFAGKTCKQALYGFEVPLLAGGHVTTEAGTGFVHTAPSHGAEDFYLGQPHGLDLECHVQPDGTYDTHVPPLPATGKPLTGVDIWSAQPLIVDELTATGALLRWHKLKHSYPVSWRSKAPLIFRTTRQWFVAMDKPFGAHGKTLRTRTLEAIKTVQWVPESGENRITDMIANRPDWCISRQRVWGVPIALFFNTKTQSHITAPEVFESVASALAKHNISGWDTLSVRELLPPGWLEKNNLSETDLVKETDILDVWFESGSTFAHVLQARLPDTTFPADLYLEGTDQHRGWFHSSLLLSVATQDCAPYKQVLTHGFAVDDKGKKVSKSLGNGDDAGPLLAKFGADILRLWVASSDYRDDVVFSPAVMEGVSDVYRRLRNTIRYLIGNTHDFDEKNAVPYEQLPELERWVLARLQQVIESVQADYTDFKFFRIYQTLHNFCAVELSSLYFDVRKDVLYCNTPHSPTRRAVQTTLVHIFRALITHLQPLIPFTADEAWRFKFSDVQAAYTQLFYAGNTAWKNSELLTRWENILHVRSLINTAIETTLRKPGLVGANMEVSVHATLPSPLYAAARSINMQELCMLSTLTLQEGNENIHAEKSTHPKCPRCWNHRLLVANGLCERCDEAVSTPAAA